MQKVKTLVQTSSLPRDIALVLLASVVFGLFAKISIPLPFTPIPLATQSFFVLLFSALLGARRAGAAVFSFLAQGALGLPVFAGGIGGIAKFAGPTGGYLIGYLAAAFVVGWLMERSKTFWATVSALTLGTCTIYLFGASYLATMIGGKKAFLLGVAPFLLGDLFKICACLKILHWKRAMD